MFPYWDDSCCGSNVVYSPRPTLAGFQAWVYSAMGIPDTVIPEGSFWFFEAYNTSLATVNLQICHVPGPFYLQAVYNLGGDFLINWAQDPVPPIPYPTGNPTGIPYLEFLRKQWNILGFTPGIVQEASDQGTAAELTLPSQYKDFTIANIAQTKTPWGRRYLAIASAVGTMWGIS